MSFSECCQPKPSSTRFFIKKVQSFNQLIDAFATREKWFLKKLTHNFVPWCCDNKKNGHATITNFFVLIMIKRRVEFNPSWPRHSLLMLEICDFVPLKVNGSNWQSIIKVLAWWGIMIWKTEKWGFGGRRILMKLRAYMHFLLGKTRTSALLSFFSYSKWTHMCTPSDPRKSAVSFLL